MIALCIVILHIGVSFINGDSEISISTHLGDIKGIKRTVLNNSLYEFRKIPYAKAPVGNLRFEKPESYGSWNITLDATIFGPSCFQSKYLLSQYLPNKIISEDCLYLNIYVPFNVSSSSKKSVMVWIHGGSFTQGQAHFYDGSRMAITGDVIVVTINYRLNIFGFLNLPGLPGNSGLWDQIMAIQWIKDNIVSFGGDGLSITIFGESAGGFSVGLLSIFPVNKGLFQRAILQSGVGISTYAIGKISKSTSIRVTENVNCTQKDPNVKIQCLKQLPPSQLYNGFSSLKHSSYLLSSIGPEVDDDLLADDPINLLHNVSSYASVFYRSLDIIIGTTSGESSLLILILQYLQKSIGINLTNGIPKSILTDYLSPEISAICCHKSLHVSAAITRKYGQSSNKLEITNDIMNAYSDYAFDVPAVQSLQLHSIAGMNRGHQYQYVFSRRSPFPRFGALPEWFTRSEHGAEIPFQFTSGWMNLTSEDLLFSAILMKYWTNFAKTGNVNSQDLPEWKEYDPVDGYYVNLDINVTTRRHLHKDRMKFWLEDVPTIMRGGISSAHRINHIEHLGMTIIVILTIFLTIQ